jgi:hypothetical protein
LGFGFLDGIGLAAASLSDTDSDNFARFGGGFDVVAGLLEEETRADSPRVTHGSFLGMPKKSAEWNDLKE